MNLYDSHNHLQDPRLRAQREGIFAALQREHVVRMVVNGTQEPDWDDVLALARERPGVTASFGLHPWYVPQRSPDWQKNLLWHLEQVPGAIGEIGLDRWIEGHDVAQQEEVFLWQWRLAVERDLPVSIHCLRAWGRLLELLREAPRLRGGFLLHSYGGSVEMIPPLAQLGAYFSISGYFAHERKARQRAAFKNVPPWRLLIETDAPDMLPPLDHITHPLTDADSGEALNHPANISSAYAFAAEVLHESVDHLATRIEENFLRLFGKTTPLNRRPALDHPNEDHHDGDH